MSQFEITLPSRGVLYGNVLPEGKLLMNSMTAKEQSILLNPGADPIAKANQVLALCLRDSPIKPIDMLITDRVYAMIVLRVRSFPNGNIYEIPARCAQCSTQYRHEVDLLKDLVYVYYEKPPELACDEEDENTFYIDPTNVSEPFEHKLPMSGELVSYRLLRGYDEERISRYSQRTTMQTVDLSDPAFAYRLSLMIQSLNGKEISMEQKSLFVNSLEAGDVQSLNEEIEEVESGCSLQIETICRKCGYVESVMMPFTADFFRPRTRKSRRHR